MKDFIQNLNIKMREEFNSLNPNLNPVAQRLPQLSFNNLLYVFEQYSLFSKNITNFLLKGFYSISHEGWKDLASELVQNIQEELNIDSHSSEHRVPHYVLLRQGFADASFEIGNIKPSPATSEFMNSILNVMEDCNPSIVSGGAYALESSAVPELDMVYTWVERAFSLIGESVPNKITTFFKSHVDEIEIGHEARLQEVCRQYILNPQQIADFENGFCRVIDTMDLWWDGLANESITVVQFKAS